jgi:hypothetical protein
MMSSPEGKHVWMPYSPSGLLLSIDTPSEDRSGVE